ncbi:MAG: hypothetical protein K5756_03330 [Clostridiales bacterium]|nr:hypothetical protein [Clostridiales bacterium]
MQIAKKVMALFLAMLMAFGTFAVGGAGTAAVSLDTTADYTGTVLAAINTNYDDFTQTFSAYSKSPARAASENNASHLTYENGDNEDTPVCGTCDTLPEPLSPAEAARKQAELGKNAEQAVPADYSVGSQKTITSHYRDKYSTDKVYLECVYTGNNCTAWMERSGDYSEDVCIELGEKFDKIIPKELALFGDKRIDTDKDGKIALFIYDMNDVGGYFAPGDLVDPLGRIGDVWYPISNGNVCDCVHLCSTSISTAIHEYQHYTQQSWQFVGKTNSTYIDNPIESYINEGFSRCAEYLIAKESHIKLFNSSSADTEKFSLVNWYFDAGAYALSYVFCQYLRTRYAQLPGVANGEDVYKTILDIRANKKSDYTLYIAADLLYPTSLYSELKTSDSRSRQLIKDFWLSVLCKEDKGIYGFNGEGWANPVEATILDDLPENGSQDIRSGMAAFYLIDNVKTGTACVTEAGKDMVFVGITGAGCSVIYDWNNGVWEEESYFRFKDTESMKYPDGYLPGKVFLGWSTDPDAAEPLYKDRNDPIPLSPNEVTFLYAVWEDARTISAEQTLTFKCEYNRDFCFRFVPEDSGCYLITTDTYAQIYSDGEQIECVWKEHEWLYNNRDHIENYYDLNAGTVYDIYTGPTFGDTYGEHWLGVDYMPQYHTVRYFVNLKGMENLFAEQRCLNNCIIYPLYIVGERILFENHEDPEHIDYYDTARNMNLEFAGWASSPNATAAQFVPYEDFSQGKDTDLYAVWLPITEMPSNGVQEFTYKPAISNGRMFSFTPDGDGTYRFSAKLLGQNEDVEVWRWLCLYDTQGNNLFCENLADPFVDFSLHKGKTYIFEVYISSNNDDTFEAELSLKKISDKPSVRLIFDMSSVSPKHRNFALTGRCIYTIPDLDPTNSNGDVFLGWSEPFSDEIYCAGDEIELFSDMILIPKWSRAAEETGIAKLLISAVQRLRFSIQWFRLSFTRGVKFLKTIDN